SAGSRRAPPRRRARPRSDWSGDACERRGAPDRRPWGCLRRAGWRLGCCSCPVDGNFEEKGRPLAGRALDPDPAAHALHRLAHDGEPDARPGVVLRTMQALENIKDAVGEFHVETDAVVAHPEDRLVALDPAADFDRRGLDAARE